MSVKTKSINENVPIKEDKVYVVTTESYLENHFIDMEVFSDYDAAKSFYDKQVAIFMGEISAVGEPNDYVISNEGDSFEGYLAGDYPSDHYTVSLRERLILKEVI